MQILRRADAVLGVTLGVAMGGVSAVFASRLLDLWWPGVLIGAAVAAMVLRRAFLRWLASRVVPTDSDRLWLMQHVPFYAGLDTFERRRFERDVQICLAELRFEGVAGAEPTPELKLAVAAGAALMLHGRPSWDVPRGRTILFYPGAFDDEFEVAATAGLDGLIHHQGPIILSVPAVEYGWKHKDGHNVVLHELAHLLDFQGSAADGLPALLAPESAGAWQDLVLSERRKVKAGKSLLRPYAGTNSAELFAVAAEQFFERPERLRAYHPELFDALTALFNFDPTPVSLYGSQTPSPPPPARAGLRSRARRA